jgi:hypothetical protein
LCLGLLDDLDKSLMFLLMPCFDVLISLITLRLRQVHASFFIV